MFQFEAADFLRMNQTRFKAIRDFNNNLIKKNSQKYTFIGVLFEKFVMDKRKIMLQN